MRRAPLALVLALVFARSASANPTGLDYAPSAAPEPPDAAGLVLRLAALTAGLLAMCGGVVWFARRAARPANLKGDGGGRLRHEASLPLDRRSAVHLVSADGQTVAVTTDATGLRSSVLLSEPFEPVLEVANAEGEAADG
ncbi:MAG: flagellar biosynthetic protein FliO [Planctomycetes bacterium]|nr:flagellar biosynthetic protein FliO [Planctomycetota bacterium]